MGLLRSRMPHPFFAGLASRKGTPRTFGEDALKYVLTYSKHWAVMPWSCSGNDLAASVRFSPLTGDHRKRYLEKFPLNPPSFSNFPVLVKFLFPAFFRHLLGLYRTPYRTVFLLSPFSSSLYAMCRTNRGTGYLLFTLHNLRYTFACPQGRVGRPFPVNSSEMQ